MRRKSLKKFLVLLLTTSMVGTMYVPAMATEVRPSDTTVESTDEQNVTDDQENQVSVQSDETTGTEENSGAGVVQIGEKTYATLQAAVDDAEDGDIVKLVDDIDLTSTVCITNKSITLDLNGKTISNTTGIWNEDIQNWSLISVRDNAKVVITGNGVLKAMEDDAYALDVAGNGAECVVEDGAFVGNLHAIYVHEGKLLIKGGTYSIQQVDEEQGYDFVLNCLDAAYNNGTATITVTGGTFEKFNPANCAAEGAGTSFVKDGYVSSANEDGTYTVGKAVAQVGEQFYADLQEAVNAATDGETVKLVGNIDLDKTVFVKNKNITLDLAGKTISNTDDIWLKVPNGWSLISVGENANVTITGNGTLQTKENDCYAVDLQDGGVCTIENGTYVGNIHAVYVHEGSLFVKGGTYSVQQKYPTAALADEFVLNCYDASRKAGTATIVVTGGSFEKFNPADCYAEGEGTSFVAAGYESKAADGVYTVSKKEQNNLETVSSVAGSASIGGNYSGTETDKVTTDNGKVSIDLKNENVTKISASTIYAGNDALTSLNENTEVSDVMISTDAGTFSINKEALSTIVTNAKENDVVLKLSKESKATGEVYYYVTATAGGQNVYTESTSATATVKISVPYYTLEDGVTATVYYVDDSGNKTAMNTTYDSATKSLTWETSHFSTFEVQTNAVAQVTDASGNVEQYSDIKAAFDNAETGSTVALLSDVDITKSEVELDDKDITLDLAGHEMKAANRVEGNIDVSGGKLTLCDSTDAKKDGSGTGRIYTTTEYDYTNGTTRNDTSKVLIAVYSGSSFELESGLIDAASGISNNGTYGQFAIGFPGYSYDEDATITINGGRIKAGWYAIAGNGGNKASKADANIIVNGGIVESTADYAIYQPNKGKTTVNGGVVYGEAGGIALKAGDLVVTGGMITSKGQGSTGTWGDGTGNLKNAAINIDGAYAQASAIITGGTIMAEGDAINVATNPKNPVSAKVSGGIFNNPVKEEYCADGFYPQAKADGTYGVQAGAAVVIATDETAVVYDTLAEAITKADNATVKLLEDTTQSIQIASNQTVTLDLNGYTLTNEAGKHTITNNGTLTVTDSSTEKTGTVDNVSHAKAAIKNENGGLVTLNAGTYTRSMENGLSSSNNGGNSYYTLYNLGTMTIESDVTVNQGSDGRGKFSSLICNGGIKGQPATLTVNGGTFEGGLNSIKNDEAGELTITDGTFNNTAQYAILNWEKTSITGGTFTVSDSASGVLCNGSYEGSAGNISISGGTFTAAENKPVIEEFAGYADGTTGTITGGIFSSEVPAKYCQSSDESSEGYLPVEIKDADGNVVYSVDNSVQANFWGGQLKMDYYKNTDGTTDYTKTDLRFGYEYQINPDIDPEAVKITAWGWKYSVGNDSLNYTLEGKNSRANTGLGKNYQTVTNLLITEVPTSAYQTDIYSQMYVTYEKDGKIYTAKTSIDHRSVSEIVNKILDDDAADDIQKKYAQGLKDELGK